METRRRGMMTHTTARLIDARVAVLTETRDRLRGNDAVRGAPAFDMTYAEALNLPLHDPRRPIALVAASIRNRSDAILDDSRPPTTTCRVYVSLSGATSGP